MSKLLTAKPSFVPAPIDGIDRVSPPNEIGATSARELDNYYIYDWGIRERGAFSNTIALPDGGDLKLFFPITIEGISSAVVSSSAGDSYLYTFSNDNFSAAVPGSITAKNAFTYSRKAYFPYGTGVYSIDLLDDTILASGALTVVGFTADFGFAYRNRVYLIHSGTGTVSYYGAGATSGAASGTFDFRDFFQRGTKLIFGTSWSYNEGLSNEELFVVGNDVGEVLVYSGDYPGHANWRIVTRVDIPTPFPGFVNSGTLEQVNVLKLGQDIVIPTTRGAISLAQIVAGRKDDDYYLLSRKIGPVLTGCPPAMSHNYPFAYFASSQDVYVLNYERGAWSRFPGIATGSDTITHLAVSTPPSFASTNPITSYLVVGTTAGGFKKLLEGALLSDANVTYTWKTPYFDFGLPVEKQSKFIRLVARDMASSAIGNSVSCSVDFDSTAVGAADAKTTTVSGTGYKTQTLAPPGCGFELSYEFSKGGHASRCNEIAGFKPFLEQGGGL